MAQQTANQYVAAYRKCLVAFINGLDWTDPRTEGQFDSALRLLDRLIEIAGEIKAEVYEPVDRSNVREVVREGLTTHGTDEDRALAVQLDGIIAKLATRPVGRR